MAAMATGQSVDFNGDGILNCADVDPLTMEIASGTNNLTYDLNGDDLVNRPDLSQWLIAAGNENVGGPFILGDVNLDGSADTSDYGGVWDGNVYTNRGEYCSGDVNADGVVDISDGLIVKTNINQMSSASLGVGEGESLVPSNLAGFIYDPADGRMYLRSESSKLTAMVITGPEANEITAFTFATDGFRYGLAWTQSVHFANKQQWHGFEIVPTTVQGTIGNHVIALYDAGLSESDFGVVEYGSDRLVQDLEGVLSTNVQVDTVLPGDANLDGFVDVADFNLWNENRFTDDASWGAGDFNDGFVDTADFNLWNENKFTSAGWDDSPAVVPEPGGLMIALFALAVATKLVRRKETAYER